MGGNRKSEYVSPGTRMQRKGLVKGREANVREVDPTLTLVGCSVYPKTLENFPHAPTPTFFGGVLVETENFIFLFQYLLISTSTRAGQGAFRNKEMQGA